MKQQYLYIVSAVAIIILILGIYMATQNNHPITVKTGDNVSVYYTVGFTNGTTYQSNFGQSPLFFVVGAGTLIPGFENAVIGMEINQTKNVTIPENEAYGPINPNLIQHVPISKFNNPNVSVGMAVQTVVNGQPLQGIVKAVNSTNVTVDFNSPLAGHTLIFTIKVLSINASKS